MTLLRDPDFSVVPQRRLLLVDYARKCAAKIRAAVKQGKLLAHEVTPHDVTISRSLRNKYIDMGVTVLMERPEP